jgi:hypothetical protein
MANVVSRYTTVNEIINRVAAAVGLTPVSDPFNSNDDNFIQMLYLLDNAGQDLIYENVWQRLVKDWSITTDSTVTTPTDQSLGQYALPADFAYLVNDTGWDTSNQLPLGGPLSNQDFAHLKGRGLSDQTVYVSYQINDNELWLFPQPPSNGQVLTFRYCSRYWLDQGGNGVDFADRAQTGADIVMYDQMMMIHRLKYEWLEAKGFPSQIANKDYVRAFGRVTGRDIGAQTINLACRTGNFPYLGTNNIPDTNFG